jgi:hypothetical protein
MQSARGSPRFHGMVASIGCQIATSFGTGYTGTLTALA